MATPTSAGNPSINPLPGVELAGTVGQVDALHPRLTKAGITTSEFWFHVIAVALSALFASGVIPTTGPIATIAMIAAAELSAFGYQVSRTMVKTSLAGVLSAVSRTAMLVLCLAAASAMLSACTAGSTVRRDASIGVVAAASCEISALSAQDVHDAGVFAQRQIDAWISGVKPGDLEAAKAQIAADLKPLRGQLLPCLIAGIIAAIAGQPPSSGGSTRQALTAAATPDAAHTVAIAFRLAARDARWPLIATPRGAQ